MRSNDGKYNGVMYASVDIDDIEVTLIAFTLPDFNKNGFFGYASTLT